jgi:hypothetical protein
MTKTAALEPISPMNTNYSPARPWTCQTDAAHECTGTVVGKVGAYPVCQPGSVAEIAARAAEVARREAWMNEPGVREMLDREAARELAWERRAS